MSAVGSAVRLFTAGRSRAERTAGLGVQHAAMIAAMLGVMLWRHEHFSQRRGGYRIAAEV